MPDRSKSQQKIVQKYIENPLLLNNRQWKNRKFDFRQWVLVMSWEPLDVYVFDACYLKICGSEFDLKAHDDILKHLSNYSLQKNEKDKKELVMSSADFEAYMREGKDPHFTWKHSMLPQIESVIWRTLKSV